MTRLQRHSLSEFTTAREVVLRNRPTSEPLRLLCDEELRLEVLDWRPARAWTPDEGCADGQPAFVAVRTLPRDTPRNQPEPTVEAFVRGESAALASVDSIAEVWRRGRRTVGMFVRPADQAPADALLAALERVAPGEHRTLECRRPRLRRKFDATSGLAMEALCCEHAARRPARRDVPRRGRHLVAGRVAGRQVCAGDGHVIDATVADNTLIVGSGFGKDALRAYHRIRPAQPSSVSCGPMRRRCLALSAAVQLACTPPAPPAPPRSPAELAGTWTMDLSPAQDGSYTQPLVIVLDGPTTFTGSVYGGNPFINGQLLADDDRLAFAFVSDESGDQGGPYYFLGVLTADLRLHGTVRSLTRKFQLRWSATRAASPRETRP